MGIEYNVLSTKYKVMYNVPGRKYKLEIQIKT